MSNEIPRVYLVDASPYIFRAHFSLPDSIKDPQGNPAAAVYGFAGFLLKLIEQENPTHLAITFDESLNTSFRNEIYPAYKAQRELPPKELEAQLEACQDVASALGMATFVDSRYEADDLIGSICKVLTSSHVPTTIVTSDKDLTQLVTENIGVLDFTKEARYDAAAVHANFGVRPDQIADYLGLAGDAVDNIPGVEGVGKKTAAKLLEHFTDLDDLYRRLDEVKSLSIRGAASLFERLGKSRDVAMLSRELATIHCDVPVAGTLADLRYLGADRAKVEAVFDRLGFGTIRKRIKRWNDAAG